MRKIFFKKTKKLNFSQKKHFFLSIAVSIILPTQISTILYISEYKEKTLSGFFIGNAVGPYEV